MAEKPNVELGQWIKIGNLNAIVCTVYENDNVEAVYLDQKKQAINEDVKWIGQEWKFAIEGSNGGYADHYPRLQQYVSILRSGKS